MDRIRAILLVILAAILVTVMVLTWGSLGSAVMAFCLITMVAAILFQKFLTNRDESDFQMED